MAITLTEKFKAEMGGKTCVYVNFIQDETTSTFTANSVGLSYIDNIYECGLYFSSQAADLTTFANYSWLTILADHTKVGVVLPAKADSRMRLMIVGW